MTEATPYRDGDPYAPFDGDYSTKGDWAREADPYYGCTDVPGLMASDSAYAHTPYELLPYDCASQS